MPLATAKIMVQMTVMNRAVAMGNGVPVNHWTKKMATNTSNAIIPYTTALFMEKSPFRIAGCTGYYHCIARE